MERRVVAEREEEVDSDGKLTLAPSFGPRIVAESISLKNPRSSSMTPDDLTLRKHLVREKPTSFEDR